MNIIAGDGDSLFGRLNSGIVISEDVIRIRSMFIQAIKCEHCKNFGWDARTMPYSVSDTSMIESWHHPACVLVSIHKDKNR